jgi:hypothetical protein
MIAVNLQRLTSICKPASDMDASTTVCRELVILQKHHAFHICTR